MMFKKVFALASVTALTGVVTSVAVSGCSSTTSAADDDGGAVSMISEAGDAKEPPDQDAGAAICPTTAAIDATSYPWKPPQVLRGSCSEKQILDLVAFFDTAKSPPYADIKSQVTDATCAKCLFVQDGVSWGAFVEKADGTFLRNNFGGCVAVLSGNDACGKAFTQFDDCVDTACADCMGAAATKECNTAAGKGACKAAATAFAAECGTADALTACDALAKTYTFEAAARALCVGTGDAGDGGDGG